MVPSGNRPSASQVLSDGRSALAGVSNERIQRNPYARPSRHFSHMLPVFGGQAFTPGSGRHRRHAPPEYRTAPDQVSRRTGLDGACNLVFIEMAESPGKISESRGWICFQQLEAHEWHAAVMPS